MQRAFKWTLCLLFAIAPIVVHAQVGNAQINAALSPYVVSGQLSGYVTILIKKGKQVGKTVNGYADIASKRPMREDTIFRAFSMTKPVTAVALMMLYEQGKWKFSDPIAKFLPELGDLNVYRGTDASGKAILTRAAPQPTMGQLVSHTAGFLYGFGDSAVDHEYQRSIPLVPSDMRASSYLSALSKIPLAYDPGAQWQYSVAMDLEGIIIERISGQPLRTFMRRHIFAPLRMGDTDFVVPASKRSRFATLYQIQDGHLVPVTDGPFGLTYRNDPALASGGAGLVTTAGDYARFATMLLNGGALDGVRILSPGSVREIMTNHVEPLALSVGAPGSPIGPRPGLEFGVNGAVVTDPAKANIHVGKGTYFWNGAAGTWFWVDPANHIAFVGMIQRLGGPENPSVDEITQRVVAELQRNPKRN